MGVTVHMELRDFILILNYPRAMGCQEVIDAASRRVQQIEDEFRKLVDSSRPPTL